MSVACHCACPFASAVIDAPLQFDSYSCAVPKHFRRVANRWPEGKESATGWSAPCGLACQETVSPSGPLQGRNRLARQGRDRLSKRSVRMERELSRECLAVPLHPFAYHSRGPLRRAVPAHSTTSSRKPPEELPKIVNPYVAALAERRYSTTHAPCRQDFIGVSLWKDRKLRRRRRCR